MLAATKVKTSGSKKNKQTKTHTHKNTYDIFSTKRATRNFLEILIHIVVVQNNRYGKEMYKKKCAVRAKLLFYY